MLSHKQVWDAIDKLAAKNRLSASALAKRAGLDPTTFNKSKRTTKQGKARWPSTESVSKILEATSTPMAEFVGLMTDEGQAARSGQRLRCINLARLRSGEGVDVSGFLKGPASEDIDLPGVDDDNAYAIELEEDLQPPFYRAGDHLVIAPSGGVRRGDRIIGRLKDGSLVAGTMVRRTAQRLVIQPFAQQAENAIPNEDVHWIARIVWVSQ